MSGPGFSLGVAWYGESLERVSWLAARLGEAFPAARVVLLGETGLPREAFDVIRGQWLSSQVLGFAAVLRVERSVDLLLLIVNGDAYVPGLNFVFGQAILGGGVAVVYTARLYPGFYGQPHSEELLRQRLLKEALHETGHALGLEHCANPRCVMSFSNSILEVDRKEPKFCPNCARRLEEKGVKVSRQYVLA